MEKQRLAWSLLTAFLVLGLGVWAAQNEQDFETREPENAPARQPRVRQRSAPRTRISMTDPNMQVYGPAGFPENRYQDQILNQERGHQELIRELNEIVKMAEEEGASRTAEAVRKMIEKREQQYRQSMEESQKRRIEMQRRIEQRMRERQQSRGTTDKAPEQAIEEQAGKQNPPVKKEEKK